MGQEHRGTSFIEQLETRRLLSGSVEFNWDGNLRYVGTDAAESVAFGYHAGDDTVRVTENGVLIYVAAGADVTGLSFFGGGGDDSVVADAHLAWYPAHFDGGDGNDTLSGTDQGTVVGGAGDDHLRGGPNASLFGGAGADDMAGGVVRYDDRTEFLYLSIDDQPNDGAAGEGDNVRACAALVGGQGNDIIHGGPGHDRLYGAGGNDRIWGAGGDDEIFGGDGDDVLTASAGADVKSGQAGTDTADYGSRFNTVRLSLDGAANDGEGYEGDNILSDVENLTGGKGNDVLTGNGVANLLKGGPGADTLYGRAGNDHLRGGDGNDSLHGQAGEDALFGEAGNDYLYARDGTKDFLSGGYGTDTGSYDAADILNSVERRA